MSTPTPELSGAALFDAAAWAIKGAWVYGDPWSLVPAMLEWLKPKGRVELIQWQDGEFGAELCNSRSPLRGIDQANDLPTALARLVVRVAELEQQP